MRQLDGVASVVWPDFPRSRATVKFATNPAPGGNKDDQFFTRGEYG